MDPILQKTLRNLVPHKKKLTIRDYQQGFERFPVESEDASDPSIPEMYELVVWKELIAPSNELEDHQDKNTNVQLQTRDDRKSVRGKVPQDCRECKLKVGDDFYSASLVNESEDGFALLVDCPDVLKVGNKVEIHTYQGRFNVRVVYLKPTASLGNNIKNNNTSFRLGIKKA
jgi:hypothetical protein